MKIVYPICFGIDLHKSFLVATIVTVTELRTLSYRNIELLDTKLEILTKPYAAAIKLLCTIPGMKNDSAVTRTSEIGTNMSQFVSSRRLCRWAGMTPGNNRRLALLGGAMEAIGGVGY